jgi:hypothetical protein
VIAEYGSCAVKTRLLLADVHVDAGHKSLRQAVLSTQLLGYYITLSHDVCIVWAADSIVKLHYVTVHSVKLSYVKLNKVKVI